jgi:hypothetical protein
MPAPAGPDAVAAFRATVVNKLLYSVGKDTAHARDRDWYVATALATRDQVTGHWMEATRRTYREGPKRVYYFSLEFLIGRQLMDALGNLGLTEVARQALKELGVDLEKLRTLEPDPGLGNGGLGRLAACFMESMATLAGAGLRLRHPLRPRDLPAAAARRVADRAPRGMALRRQSPGSSSARRSRTRSASAAMWTSSTGLMASRGRSGIPPSR